jgi:hypothetical protein
MNNLQMVLCLLLSITYAFVIGWLFYMRLKDSQSYNPNDYGCYGSSNDSDQIIAKKISEKEFECINNFNANNKYVCGIYKDKNSCQTALASIKGGEIGYNPMAKYFPLYETNKYKDTIDSVLEYIKTTKPEIKPEVIPEVIPEVKQEVKTESS